MSIESDYSSRIHEFYIRSQNTVDYQSTDECESEYILPRTGSNLLAHVNLKSNTEAFQASEVYKERAGNLCVIDVKSQIGFEWFAETFDLHDFTAIFPYTDYAGFHATDVNWYEEGNYRTGLIRVNLFHHLEGLFRDGKFLEGDQELTPICHYSENPGEALLFPFLIQESIPRPNLVIDVTGGEHDSWGQFICINLGERRFFEMVDDKEYVSEAFSRWEGRVG